MVFPFSNVNPFFVAKEKKEKEEKATEYIRILARLGPLLSYPIFGGERTRYPPEKYLFILVS